MAQKSNKHYINAKLNSKKDLLTVEHRLIYFNNSTKKMSEIYFHNWANSYKDKNTKLGKRFLDDYKTTFQFSEKKEKGFSKIKGLSVDGKKATFYELKKQNDVFKILLNQQLKPNDSTTIIIHYKIKIPDAKFTNFGKTENGYHLRFWQVNPVVYKKKWQTMSNLDMDDLLEYPSDYTIKLKLDNPYIVNSNLLTDKKNENTFLLSGKKQKDIIISIDKKQNFKKFITKKHTVITDLFNEKITDSTTTKLLEKQLSFLEEKLGSYPYKKILVDKNSTDKNSLYAAFKLPDFLSPYPENFNWEIQFFNSLSTKYINNSLSFNKRKDYWLNDGLQTYLMMLYVNTFYPNLKVLGKYSPIWGVRFYNLSKQLYNDKYSFVYRFTAGKFYEQALTTQSDSLSTFNRKVSSKYKAGMALNYLEDYLEPDVLKKSVTKFYKQNKLKITDSKAFKNIVEKNTNKKTKWFFNQFLQTKTKIDYKIKKSINKGDSLKIIIKNKGKITVPIKLYAFKKDSIIATKWFEGIDYKDTLSIKNKNYDKVAINAEKIYPEYNMGNNYRSTKNKLFTKPLQIRFFKDVYNPETHQFFLDPDIKYNLYDGFILGTRFHNKPILDREFEFIIVPNYGFKSNSLGGSGFIGNNHHFEKSKIYKIYYGISGSSFRYKENLSYNSFSSYMGVQFKRKRLRDVGNSGFSLSYNRINKEIADTAVVKEQDKYAILNVAYYYNSPKLMNAVGVYINSEIGNNFAKITSDIRYRTYIGKHRNLYLRFFSGVFLNNSTTDDYFSYGLDRGNDYLFRYNLFGRSETSGIFSQQYVIGEGGFKAKYKNPLANRFMVSGNSSISLWRWLELYNDAAVYKSDGNTTKFAYENGIRLNFVTGILEFYLPLYNNQNGWELSNKYYASKIRFTFTANINAIYDFIRRGFL